MAIISLSSISSSDNTSQGLVIKENSDVEILSVDDGCFTDSSDEERSRGFS